MVYSDTVKLGTRLIAITLGDKKSTTTDINGNNESTMILDQRI